MIVLAIDPGVTTGLASYNTETDELRTAEEPSANAVADLVATGAIDWIVLESFQLSTRSLKKSTAGMLQTIELIGVIRYLATKRDIPVRMQSAAEKEFTTAEKLRRLGWWTVGSDHARSATKHLVLYLVQQGLLDARRLIESASEEEA